MCDTGDDLEHLPRIGQQMRLTGKIDDDPRCRVQRVVDRTNESGNGGTPKCDVWVTRSTP